MKVGIPKEVMQGEGRVALVPADCAQLTARGVEVFLETGAGLGSNYADDEYHSRGVVICDSPEALYDAAELVVKVKQPLPQGLHLMSDRHCVFSFLHLAPQPELTRQLCDIGLTAIAFESVVDSTGSHPLLAPMSAIAGRLAVITGAGYLYQSHGGKGVLLGGISSTDNCSVVVLGAGTAGEYAIATATALGADVTVFDLSQQRLSDMITSYSCMAYVSTETEIAARVATADLVIGAVMLSGRRAPVVVRQAMVENMQPGSVIVDIAIDQGGCIENIHATSHADPVYTEHGILHHAVPNMPGAVPRTAAQALSSAILPYVIEIVEKGVINTSFASATTILDGEVVDPVLREEQGL